MPARISMVEATTDPVVIAPEDHTRLTAGIINDSHRRLFLKYGTGASPDNFSLVLEPGQSGSILTGWREAVTGFWEPLGSKKDGSFYFEDLPARAMITDLKGRRG